VNIIIIIKVSATPLTLLSHGISLQEALNQVTITIFNFFIISFMAGSALT
jgi:hypothetical protein